MKRLWFHAGGFNLGLIMRHAIGIGTPKRQRERIAVVRRRQAAGLQVLLADRSAVTASGAERDSANREIGPY